jgi:hypothetical protein
MRPQARDQRSELLQVALLGCERGRELEQESPHLADLIERPERVHGPVDHLGLELRGEHDPAAGGHLHIAAQVRR